MWPENCYNKDVMQPTVNYLNLEYLLVRMRDIALSVQNSFGSIPADTVSIITAVFIIGMIASLALIVLIVYAQMKLMHTEHAGFSAMEEKELERKTADVEDVGRNDRWDGIVKLASSSAHGDWRRAILEADIMLGDVLMGQGYEGAGVGEQLKMANPIQMTTLDLAWKAHKVRNDIAHQGESYELNVRDTQTTIDYYKRVFEELGAI